MKRYAWLVIGAATVATTTGCQDRKQLTTALAEAKAAEAEKDSLLNEVLETTQFVSEVNAELAKVKAELEATGATVTASAKKVGGFDGESWAIAQRDEASGIEVQRERIYVPVPVEGVQILALVQAEANKIEFAKYQADFDTIIGSIVLPGAE